MEDSAIDARLVRRALDRGELTYDYRREATLAGLQKALDEADWDVIIVDHHLADCDSRRVLTEVKSRGLDIPFIICSGTIGEEQAVAAMKAGAQDYIMKGNLSRLAEAVRREVRDAAIRRSSRTAEEELRRSEQRLALLLSQSDELVLHIDQAGQVIEAWGNAEILSSTLTKITNRHLTELFHRTNAPLLREALARVTSTQGHLSIETYLPPPSNRTFLLHFGLQHDQPPTQADGCVLIRDITAIRQTEAELTFLSRYDPLTHLPNRKSVHDQLQKIIDKRTSASHHYTAVLLIDLDRFKVINDNLGHTTGDEVLVGAAHEIRRKLRQDDILARYSSDEFLAILPDVHNREAATQIAQQILDGLPATPLSPSALRVTASIGISFSPGDGHTAEDLIAAADVAMHEAKKQGGGSVHHYTPELGRRGIRRLELEQQLRIALEQNQLTLNYQPQVDLRTGAMIGVEALARWQHPETGAISPSEFIPVAEESGIIIPLGEWVLNRACEDAMRWRQHGVPLEVAVNVSAVEFEHVDIASRVSQALSRTHLPVEALVLELTESVLMDDTEEAIRRLQTLREMGVRIAVDDFGSGYSNLSYLKRLPLNKLKIDQSLIRGLGKHANDEALVRAVIQLAHSLKLDTLAEGVETETTRQFLHQHHCRHAQGYLFGRAQPAEHFLSIH
ncbi:hypothetical protein CAI21_18440 [Alkalilimnicola ehrlichii]|nr:EAL domain-containing protein [Alkalilimnicola ehrlichii]RFA25748.1 hypothetical protein CAI21_18440 [Alkalilimnicola ehrlichii]